MMAAKFISTGLSLIVVMLAACSPQYPKSCPSSLPLGLLQAREIAADPSLPFRFPLESSTLDERLFFGWFGVSNECPTNATDCFSYPVRMFHAAEDYKRPPGTPVYAMADGQISYSALSGGYGWLIIIDHPQANLYSLYGHLSPSRWKLGAGTAVKRGDLIAYLGDSDENGGSVESPLVPHLHFGIRAGQMANYPVKRGMALYGWLDQDLSAGLGLVAALCSHHRSEDSLRRIFPTQSRFPDSMGRRIVHNWDLYNFRGGVAYLWDQDEVAIPLVVSRWCRDHSCNCFT